MYTYNTVPEMDQRQQKKIIMSLDELEKMLIECSEQTGFLGKCLDAIMIGVEPKNEPSVLASHPVQPASLVMLRIESAKCAVREIISKQQAIISRLDI